MKLFPFTCTADTFQKLSKAYSILTDPAAKVVTNLLLDVWLYGSVDAVCLGCIRQVAEGQARCKEETRGAECKKEETQREYVNTALK